MQYLLQTNLYPSARKRKMAPFEDFIRKAVVIVPSRENYDKRFRKQTAEGKTIPKEDINKMKGEEFGFKGTKCSWTLF